MKAMILSAGGATRLYPLTYSLPKPLVPVMNVPVIEHIVELLKRHGFDEIVINLHYQAKLLISALGDGSRFGVKIQYSVEEELLGTAGGLRQVAAQLDGDEPFLVIGGDTLTDLDLTSMLNFHRQHKALATVAVQPLADRQKNSEMGILELDGDDRVTWFLEKPGPSRGDAGHWGSGGIYLFDPSFLTRIPAKGACDLALQVFPELVRNREAFFGFSMGNAYWCDIGSHLRYRQTHWDLLHGRTKIRIPGKELHAHVWVEEGAVVHPRAILKAPLLIGAGCRIDEGVELQGPTVLGAGTHIQAGARVKNSILWERSVVAERAVVEDCLTGSQCRLLSQQRYSKMVLGSGARDEGAERESID